MTHIEAANYLGLSNYQDLDEAIEEHLFQCRQEIIQKADQVLLFPAKEKRFILLQTAAESLGFEFHPFTNSQELIESQSVVIEERFQHFQVNRSQLLKVAGQIDSFIGLVQIQHSLRRNYLGWARFWKDVQTIPQEDIKLTSVLDSMRFYQEIQAWKKQGIHDLNQLNPTLISTDIQGEIQRLQLVFIKLS